MSFTYACPYCGKQLVVSPVLAGKEHTCPRCRAEIKLPSKAPTGLAANRPEDDSKFEPLSLGSPPKHDENLIDMTAMVDIVFFLLIFFMVTSIQAIQSVMELPPAQTSGESTSTEVAPDYSTDPSYLTVTIEADDSIWVDDEQIYGAQQLRTKLRQIRKEEVQINGMMVVGDPEASHGTLVMVLDAGADAGFEDLRFSLGSELDPFAG